MKKYKLKLREVNTNSLKIYFVCLTIYYAFKVAAHFLLRDGLVFNQDQNLGLNMVYPVADENSKFLVN